MNKETGTPWVYRAAMIAFLDMLIVLASYLLDSRYHCGILRMQAVPQHLASGQRAGGADVHYGIYRATAGVRPGDCVYEPADAQVLLFYWVYFELLPDNRPPIFLQIIPSIFE